MSTVLHEQRQKLQIQISNSISEIRKHGNIVHGGEPILLRILMVQQ